MFKEVKFPRTEEWFELEVVLTAENDFFCNASSFSTELEPVP